MVRRALPTGDLSDEALLAALAGGDADAGAAFIRRYAGRAYGIALRIIGDPGLAEDVAQDALVRCWRHAGVYDPRRGAVGAWVCTIARNLAIDALRLQRPTPFDPALLAEIWAPAPGPSPEDEAVNADAFAGVRVALGTLSPEQRRALVRATFGGESAAEIAAAEQIPLGTAKTRIRSGLAKVRAALSGTDPT